MQGSDRHIAHLDMDHFFVAVERLRDSSLKSKPILIGGSNDRGIVAACSDEAKKFGIHPAMPMRIALRLCKYATVLKTDHEVYSQYSKLIYEIIKDSTPLVERSNLDSFYVDLSGMDKFFGCKKFTNALQTKVHKESGLLSNYGLASNKVVSKVAAREGNGQLAIPFGEEKPFLAPLSITKIPGVGTETAMKLIKMGVETIKVLSDIPVEMLQNLLGKSGNELWRRANGIDESPVIPFQEQSSFSTEFTFQQDTIDLQVLHSELTRMTESIGFVLRTQHKLTGCVTVKLRYSDGDTHTLQKKIPYANVDHILVKVAKGLFQQLFTRRVLVRLVGVRFTNLIPGTYQIDLFEDSQEMIKLYQAIDSVKKRYGQKYVQRAS